jgi:sarcosine oxidase
MNDHFDHIVIGTGSMGAATCYYLAKRGYRVLGIDQFPTPHEWGSHGGQSRIIRKAYFEHPDYIPLLKRAYQNWAELEKATGANIYFPTGLAYAGPQDDEMLKGVKASASQYDVALTSGNEKGLQQQWPQFELPAGYETLFEPEAGFIRPATAIRSFLQEAKRYGAELLPEAKVAHWKYEADKVMVHTDKGDYSCKKLVVTAGAWSSRLIPGIQQLLKVTRQVLVWVDPPDRSRFEVGKFPCWLIATPDQPGAYYGFPIPEERYADGPHYLKIAYHYGGEVTNPDEVNRVITDADTEPILSFLKKYIPDAVGPIAAAKVCLYEYSPDEHFVIDNLPGYEDRVCVAWGFSGHGFKFASAIGEIMADLATKGTTPWPIGFLNARRLMG